MSCESITEDDIKVQVSSSSSSTSITDALQAREIPSMVNSAELLKKHALAVGNNVRTRFPPEPNGYLHIGHAKSMNMNFSLAFEKLGVAPENRETIFRYDDTNPEAESQEYIDSLRNDLEWLGWKPLKTTFSSDYFDILYEYALKLIREDKAYVCHQNGEEISASRDIAKRLAAKDPTVPEGASPDSPWRNRPVEESLRIFQEMKQGRWEEAA